LVTSAYRRSFFHQGRAALATARAGNVIGGGDWAADRLRPDILRAFEKSEPVEIRNPQATRPWQHVLEPLCGYLTLAQRLWSEGQGVAEAWNFGPGEDGARPVQWIVERLAAAWGCGATWHLDDSRHPHEAGHLKLDISKARQRLDWQPRWALDTALVKIVDWHQAWRSGDDMHQWCLQQIRQYTETTPRNAS
jgi:CDP-glucose 4,6-dehydratase